MPFRATFISLTIVLLSLFSGGCPSAKDQTHTGKDGTVYAPVPKENIAPPPGQVIPDTFPGLAEYQRYLNPKYNFCVEFPANFLTPGEDEGEDGKSFVSAHTTCAMVAYGYANDSAWTLQDYYSRSLSDSINRKEGKTVIRHKKGNDGFDLYGTRNDLHFASRMRVNAKEVITVYFEYPASMAKELDPVAEHIVESFPACKASSQR